MTPTSAITAPYSSGCRFTHAETSVPPLLIPYMAVELGCEMPRA